MGPKISNEYLSKEVIVPIRSKEVCILMNRFEAIYLKNLEAKEAMAVSASL